MHTPLLFIRSGNTAWCFVVVVVAIVLFVLLLCWCYSCLEEDKREEAKEEGDGKVDHDLVVLGLEGDVLGRWIVKKVVPGAGRSGRGGR